MSKDKKLKIDFLTKEASPHLIDLRKKEKERIKFSFSVHLFRKIYLAIGIIILIFAAFLFVKSSLAQVLELKIKLVENQFYNLESFFDGLENLRNFNFAEAEKKFNLAKNEFSYGLNKIEETNFLIKFFLKIYPRSTTAVNLLKIFKDSSEAGEILAKTGQELQLVINFKSEKKENEILPPEILETDFLALTSNLEKKAIPIASLISKIEKNFSEVNLNYVPPDFRKIFEAAETEIGNLNREGRDLLIFLKNFKKIVGKDGTKKYLIVFQNNNEIRPTGGFLGTYTLVDFEAGKIKRFEMPAGGSYDLAGWLTVRLAPPAPFIIAYPKWQFHDANWFPDFPASAQKLIWFLEYSSGPTVDGVIALNAELITDFLEVTGEISLPAYQKTISQDNFILETQKAIEIERKEKRKPKQFLVDLTPILLKKIFTLEPDKLVKLLEKISLGLKEKKILFYFSDRTIEKFFQDKNWAGEMKETPLDYLMAVNANVGGSKTEGVISQKVKYHLEINSDGTATGQVAIKRIHQGERGNFFTGKKDLNWLRVYLPGGAVFLSAHGGLKKEWPKLKQGTAIDEDLQKIEKEISFDSLSATRITEEFGKTCFGNFMELEPGQEKELSFTYLLPFKLDFNKETNVYSLLIQKQSGRKSELEIEIVLPVGKEIIWRYPLEVIKENNVVKFKTDLDSDKLIAFIIK